MSSLNLSQERVNADLMTYKGVLSRLEGAKEIMKVGGWAGQGGRVGAGGWRVLVGGCSRCALKEHPRRLPALPARAARSTSVLPARPACPAPQEFLIREKKKREEREAEKAAKAAKAAEKAAAASAEKASTA